MSESNDFEDVMGQFFDEFTGGSSQARKPGDGETVCPTCTGQGRIRRERKLFILGTLVNVRQCSNCKGTGVAAES